MQIRSLKELIQEYENGKLFRVTNSSGMPSALTVQDLSIVELEHMIGTYQVISIPDLNKLRTEWDLLTECADGTYVPENGVCPCCLTDLIQHFMITNQANGVECPTCSYSFTGVDLLR